MPGAEDTAVATHQVLPYEMTFPSGRNRQLIPYALSTGPWYMLFLAAAQKARTGCPSPAHTAGTFRGQQLSPVCRTPSTVAFLVVFMLAGENQLL